jgi:hypothetical protein
MPQHGAIVFDVPDGYTPIEQQHRRLAVRIDPHDVAVVAADQLAGAGRGD